MNKGLVNMNFDTSTLMMIFFITALVVSIWKIYAFLPNKQLADDDTTKESRDELIKIMLKTIESSNSNINEDELFVKMESSEYFDNERFWRFNLNRLRQLLNHYYLQNPHVKDIADIYKNLK